MRGDFPHPGQFAASPGQNDTAARQPGKACLVEALADHFEDFLETRPDDAGQHRFGRMIDRVDTALAKQRHRHGLAIIDGGGHGAAEQRLQALGMGDGGGQSPRYVMRDMHAANRDHIGEHQLIVVERGDAGGGAAHVDERHAELDLVPGENRARRGIRCDDIIGDQEMAALDDQRQIAQCRRFGGDDIDFRGERGAEHAERRGDAARSVEMELRCCRVQCSPAGLVSLGQSGTGRGFDILRRDLAGSGLDRAGI